MSGTRAVYNGLAEYVQAVPQTSQLNARPVASATRGWMHCSSAVRTRGGLYSSNDDRRGRQVRSPALTRPSHQDGITPSRSPSPPYGALRLFGRRLPEYERKQC